MSPELKAFYQSYQAWLDAGAPERKPYWRDSGLCFNSGVYTDTTNSNIFREMINQFNDSKHDVLTPFNSDSNDYNSECARSECHLNSFRIQWVREHAKD